jgi:aspartate kinase
MSTNMGLIVQKYGGTSVGDTDRIKNVANRIKMYYDQGHDLVVVVSAMGHTTDQLIEMAKKIHPFPKAREMDVLLSTGEQVSIALLAMALDYIGVPAISFTGAQAQILTDKKHSMARIQSIDTARITEQLKQKKVVIVAGFQGIDEDFNITTLGRGGSDLTAVALAAALKADACEIYTDVDGVYTTDPNKVPSAKKILMISYEEMLELARLGAGVLHSRSVEVASKYNVIIHVRSSFNNNPGTLVVPEEKIMEKVLIRGVTLKTDEARISVMDIPDRPGLAANLFNRLARADINVDMIVQSTGKDQKNTISFTIPVDSLYVTKEIVESFIKEMGAGSYDVDENIAIVSAVGIGMKSHSGVAGKMFEALAKENINIEMISTSEIKISVVVKKDVGKKALQAVHDAFELDKVNS